MVQNDRQEKDRVDARNELEEFIYDMRDKLNEQGSLKPYVVDDDRRHIFEQLEILQNWIYEEGEDCTSEEYRSRKTDLEILVDPIKARQKEFENQPRDFEDLGHAIQMARKAVLEYREGAEKYDHLTETEILNLSESTDRVQIWRDEEIVTFERASKTMDLPITSSQIRDEIDALNQLMNSILNRPKPKPPTPPVDQQANNNTEYDTEPMAEPKLTEDKMDVE